MRLPKFDAASFKGILLSVPRSGRTVQRAIVQYTSPYSNYSQKDDLGLASETLSVEAFVSGPDAYERAASLRTVLDEGGLGTLVHPNYGTMDVYVQSYDEREDYVDGLYFVGFNLQFVRADESAPLGNVQASTAVEQAALALQDEFAAAARRRVEQIEARQLLSLPQLHKELADFGARLQAIYRITEMPFEFSDNLLRVCDELEGLVLSPADLVARLMQMSADLADGILSVPSKAFQAMCFITQNLRGGFERLQKLVDGGRLHQVELQLLNNAAQLAAAVSASPKLPYRSTEEARRVSQELLEQVAALKYHAPYSTYEALATVELAYMQQSQQQIAELPPEQPSSSTEPLPVAMHRVQGQALNRLPNPFFPQFHYFKGAKGPVYV